MAVEDGAKLPAGRLIARPATNMRGMSTFPSRSAFITPRIQSVSSPQIIEDRSDPVDGATARPSRSGSARGCRMRRGITNFPLASTTRDPAGMRTLARRPRLVILPFSSMTIAPSGTGAAPVPSMSVPPATTRTSFCRGLPSKVANADGVAAAPPRQSRWTFASSQGDFAKDFRVGGSCRHASSILLPFYGHNEFS